MQLRFLFSLMLVAVLSACGSDQPAPSESASASAPAAASPSGASAATSPVDAGKGLEGIVLRYAPGGRPDAFCTPEWSIANETATDIPGLMIQIAWLGPDGQEFKGFGEFGTLVENLGAGRVVDRTLEGHLVACNQLRIVVGTYACRDDNAVRSTCPGPLHVITEGGIEADVSGMAEGPMRGAMEP